MSHDMLGLIGTAFISGRDEPLEVRLVETKSAEGEPRSYVAIDIIDQDDNEIQLHFSGYGDNQLAAIERLQDALNRARALATKTESIQ